MLATRIHISDRHARILPDLLLDRRCRLDDVSAAQVGIVQGRREGSGRPGPRGAGAAVRQRARRGRLTKITGVAIGVTLSILAVVRDLGLNAVQAEAVVEDPETTAQNGRRLSARSGNAVGHGDARCKVVRAMDHILSFIAKTVADSQIRSCLPVVLGIQAQVSFASTDCVVGDGLLPKLADDAALIRRVKW